MRAVKAPPRPAVYARRLGAICHRSHKYRIDSELEQPNRVHGIQLVDPHCRDLPGDPASGCLTARFRSWVTPVGVSASAARDLRHSWASFLDFLVDPKFIDRRTVVSNPAGAISASEPGACALPATGEAAAAQKLSFASGKIGESMVKIKYRLWVTPAYALAAAVFAIPALGGPAAILTGTVTYQVALAAARFSARWGACNGCT
jgi:hypothetical protein